MANIILNGVTIEGVLTRTSMPVIQETPIFSLTDGGVAGKSSLQYRTITLQIAIYDTSYAAVQAKLDLLKASINTDETMTLRLSTLNDRYWNVRMASLQGEFSASRLWNGQLTFIAADPLAYSVTEFDEFYIL